jgi:hypothetical protein
MTRPIYFLASLLLLSPLTTEAKKLPTREKLVERIIAACEPRVAEDHDNFGAICACISRDLNAKLSHEDLALITRSHENDPKAEKELQEPQHDELVLDDYDIVEDCLEKP